MSRWRLDGKGITLVEVLAVTVLMGIIIIFVSTLIIESNQTSKEIKIETMFRDEADLIMSNFIKTMYETKQSNIIEHVNNANSSYINVTTDPAKCEKNGLGNLPSECLNTLKKIGFITDKGQTKLYLKDEEYKISNQNISILSDSKITENPDGTYEVVLNLQYKSQRGGKEESKNMKFRNIIQPF